MEATVSGRRRKRDPGRSAPRNHKTTSEERLAWAIDEWKRNPRIPVNGDGGMIRRMKAKFGLATDYETLTRVREAATAQPTNGVSKTPKADKSSAEKNLEIARAKRKAKSNIRRDFAVNVWKQTPWLSIDDVGSMVKGKFGQGISNLYGARREALDALGLAKAPKAPVALARDEASGTVVASAAPAAPVSPPAPEPPATTPPAQARPTKADIARDEDAALATYAEMILADFPNLDRFEIRVGDEGDVDLAFEFKRRRTITLNRGDNS